MISKRNAVLMLCVLFFLGGLSAAADNVSSRVSDPQENASLTQLASAERLCEHHNWALAAEKAHSLLSNRPIGRKRRGLNLHTHGLVEVIDILRR